MGGHVWAGWRDRIHELISPRNLPNVEDPLCLYGVVKIAGAMCRFDQLLDCAEAEQMDDLWKQLRQTAADQIYQAWSEVIREKLYAICDTIGSYCPGFISAPRIQTTSIDAIEEQSPRSALHAFRGLFLCVVIPACPAPSSP